MWHGGTEDRVEPSQLQGLILNLGYYLCRVLQVLSLSAWISSGFSHFLPLSQNMQVGRLAKLIVSVWICVCIVPRD